MLKEAFERNVLKLEGNGGCWIWQGNLIAGYGKLLFCGEAMLAHRTAYELYVGSIPKDKGVLHKCHNRQCTNPEHMYLGTPQDNARDWLESRKKDALYTPVELKGFRKIEKDLIISTLKNNQNSRAKTARDLGLSTTTLWRKMKKCGLQ